MLAIFSKKKISEDKLANVLVNSLLELSESGFADVAATINEDPEFRCAPSVAPNNDKQFLLIVIAGNLHRLNKHLKSGQDKRVKSMVISKIADVFEITGIEMENDLSAMSSFMKRVNHPSKNTLYAMSKAIFYKYDLNQFQEEYFRNMNAPNPIFLKRLNEVMLYFLWDWQEYLEEYKITN